MDGRSGLPGEIALLPVVQAFSLEPEPATTRRPSGYGECLAWEYRRRSGLAMIYRAQLQRMEKA